MLIRALVAVILQAATCNAEENAAGGGEVLNLHFTTATVIGYTSFEEPPVAIDVQPYEGHARPSTDSQLANGLGHSAVQYAACSSGTSELGFHTHYVNNTNSLSRITGREEGGMFGLVGVAGSTAGASGSGPQYFTLMSPHGFVYVAIDPVRVVAYANVTMSGWVYVEGTSRGMITSSSGSSSGSSSHEIEEYAGTSSSGSGSWQIEPDDNEVKMWATETQGVADDVVLIGGGSVLRHQQRGQWAEYTAELVGFEEVSMQFGLKENDIGPAVEVRFDYFALRGSITDCALTGCSAEAAADRAALLCENHGCTPNSELCYLHVSQGLPCTDRRGYVHGMSRNETARNSLCIECNLGTVNSDANVSTACEACIENCTACVAGMMLNSTTNSTCIDCPKGKKRTDEMETCEQCDPGQFQNEEGMSYCTTCVAGTTLNSTTNSTCIDCPKGKKRTDEMETCEQCDPGQYQNEEGMPYCYACAPGKYQAVAGRNKCNDCKPGRYNSPSRTECIACEFGRGTGLRHPNACQLCEVGRWYDPEIHDVQDSIKLLGNDTSSCRACAPGQHTYGDGSKECAICPPDEGKVEGFICTGGGCKEGHLNDPGPPANRPPAVLATHQSSFLTFHTRVVPHVATQVIA